MASLPNEIHDYVIDFLHKDRRTLSTCSLVCKEWVPSARLHLAPLINLRVQDVDLDLDILSSPLATIPPYIKHLHIDGSDDMEPYLRLFERLLRGLPQMKRLKSLKLSDISFMLDASAKGNLFSISHNISTLELINVSFQSSGEQTELIAASPSLEALFLSSITYRVINLPLRNQPAPPLRKLQLFDTHSWHSRSSTTCSVLNWLALDSHPIPTLSTLELRGLTDDNITDICTYVHSLSRTLQNIIIECSEVAAQDALSQQLDLSNFESLENIVFHAPTYDLERLDTEGSTWIQRILSKVSSQRIQMVSFKLDFHVDQANLARFDLPAVGKLFTGGISCLSASTTKIHFEVASRYLGVDELRRPIVDHLPGLADRLEFGPGPKL